MSPNPPIDALSTRAITAALKLISDGTILESPIASHAEGYAVIREHLDEFWWTVRHPGDDSAANDRAALRSLVRMGSACVMAANHLYRDGPLPYAAEDAHESILAKAQTQTASLHDAYGRLAILLDALRGFTGELMALGTQQAKDSYRKQLRAILKAVFISVAELDLIPESARLDIPEIVG